LSRALLPFITFLLFGGAAYARIVSDILKALQQAVDCGSCHAVLAHRVSWGFGIFKHFNRSLQGRKGEQTQTPGLIVDVRNRLSTLMFVRASFHSKDIAHDRDLRRARATGVSAIPLLVFANSCNPLQSSICQARNCSAIDRNYTVHIDVDICEQIFDQPARRPEAESNCTKPICCRKYADQTGSVKSSAGPMGSRGCDTPPSLAHSMMQAVKNQNTRFSIFI